MVVPHNAPDWRTTVNAPIHYIPEYGADGLVSRLVWSPEIQQAGEQAAAARREKTAERERFEKRAKLPLSSMREWAAKRGLGESQNDPGSATREGADGR